MKKYDFSIDQKEQMKIWRVNNISTKQIGTHNGKKHRYIIPKHFWKETLWSGIRAESELPQYLKDKNIQSHTGTHNLVSSWINCANLYFPILSNKALKTLMLEFQKLYVSNQITKLTGVDLEFAFQKGDELHPATLLGEKDGSRGSGQTSPDVAFWVETKNGNEGIILTECKYTEHSFYSCSARKVDNKLNRINNPAPKRCMQKVKDCDYTSVCHQAVWGRKYIGLINYSDFGKSQLGRCPAATAGYQLLRQQALAEGIANSGRYSLVASIVAFDERNTTLKRCLRTTGIDDFQTGWGKLFEGKAIFKTWTHQDWVQFVRDNQKNGEHDDWLNYLNKRYNY